MMYRRQLLGSGGFASVLGLLAPNSSNAQPAAGQASESAAAYMIAAQIERLRLELRSEWMFSDVEVVRNAQKTYVRGNGKLPDFIEVGTDLWFAIYDWHVRWQQPLTVGRDANGRHTIVFQQTTVILRADMTGTFIGLPYDNK